jgi:ATP-binding cassette subfamily C exporter for protease/lipase
VIGVSLPIVRGELGDAVADLRRGLVALGVFSGCINLLLLMPALYMLQVYDRVLTSRNEGTLLALSALLVALLAVEALLDWVRSRLLGAMGGRLDDRLDGQVFDAAFKRSLSGQPGTPTEAFNDLAKIREFIAGKGLLAIFDAPWAPVFLVAIFLLDGTLGIFAMIAMLILVALAWYNQRSTGSMMSDAGRLAAAAQDEATSRLRNLEIISALGMLGRFRERWITQQHRIRRVSTDLGNRAALLGSASRYARLVLQSGILGIGAWLVLNGQLTAGGMIAASILLGRALSPFELLISHWSSIAKAKESALRLSTLLTLRVPTTPHVVLPRPNGRISVENLVMAPPGYRIPTIRNLSFEVEPGALVGIVGPSGSGKSTVGRALLGIWQPLSGVVRIDGAAVHQLDREDIGRWLGYLPQDVELFDGTVAENIARFGELDSAKIIDAAQRAGVHDLILRMPKGYETQIGPAGAVLSGGQRQRIGLARALFGDPALIVLDEPNASLDEAGDEALLAALRKMKTEQRTVFVISHRVNVLRLVDQIIVLDAGALKLVGSRDHVLRAAHEARALSKAVGA